MSQANKENVSEMIRQARETVKAMGSAGEFRTIDELKAELERMTAELKSNRSSEDRAQKLARLRQSRDLVLEVMGSSLKELADAALADLEGKATPSAERSALTPAAPETKSTPSISAFVPPASEAEKPKVEPTDTTKTNASFEEFKQKVDPEGKRWPVTVWAMYLLSNLKDGISSGWSSMMKFFKGFTGSRTEKKDEPVQESTPAVTTTTPETKPPETSAPIPAPAITPIPTLSVPTSASVPTSSSPAPTPATPTPAPTATLSPVPAPTPAPGPSRTPASASARTPAPVTPAPAAPTRAPTSAPAPAPTRAPVSTPTLHPEDAKLQSKLSGGLNASEAKALLADQAFKNYLARLPVPEQQKRIEQIIRADTSGALKGKLEQASVYYVYDTDKWKWGTGSTVNSQLSEAGLSEKEGKLLVRRYVELKKARLV